MHADIAVVTNDNPRTEDPTQIAEAVEVGPAKRAALRRWTPCPAPKQYMRSS